MNMAVLMGRLGRDPELKQAQAGGQVCSFSLATNEREKQGDQWVDVTEWHTVVCFGRLAELVAERCRKGEQVLVQGRMKLRKWVAKDGQEKQRTEVIATTVQFLAKGDGGQSGGHSGGQSRGQHDDGTPF